MKNKFKQYSVGILMCSFQVTMSTGCLSPDDGEISSSTDSSSGTTSSEVTTSSSKAVKIIFRQHNPSGSFGEPSSGGTKNGDDGGHRATRLFNPDGSLLADGTDDTNWPGWLEYVEIGISGSNNSAATHTDCARFSDTGEDTDTKCDFDLDGTADQPCGAPEGIYRVAERACVDSTSTITTGNGGNNDGVYIRAVFNRNTSYLGSSENLLITIDYIASGLNRSPSDPTECFDDGVFDPTDRQCSDMSWQIFWKHSVSEVVQGQLYLVPPLTAFVDTANDRGGSNPSSRQFYFPVAADSDLKVWQLSRIKALTSTATNFSTACPSSNSALCVGMVFYSMTIYRI